MKQNDRYSRQILFSGIGEEGQRRLLASRVLIVGCGALGSAQAESLARAGVGRLRIADRDFIEYSNLQRQTMFTESDADNRLPKAVACANHIREINSEIEVEPNVTDVSHSNIERLIDDCALVLDGTDNFATRYLINDACIKQSVNWIYGAAVGSYGVTMTIRPGETPCLRCVFPETPPAASAPTCDTAGVIMPIITVIASIQAAEALKLLTGQKEKLHHSLIRVNVWDSQFNILKLSYPREDCPACSGEFEFLRGVSRQVTTTLCGRNAVQIARSNGGDVDLATLAERLKSSGEVTFNDFLLRFRVDGYDITIFRDARSIIRGTSDPAIARGLYARYIGT